MERTAATTLEPAPIRRRDLHKEQTRLDLALKAYELVRAKGLASVRVPEIAAAAGVSTRTFNNYFSSKEAAIVWPSTLRGESMAKELAARPDGESMAEAVVEVVAGLYGSAGQDGLPDGWLEGFRALVASEPALHGEYLKALSDSERAFAKVIATRSSYDENDLEPLLLAGVIFAAERAAVLHWFRKGDEHEALADVVRSAVTMAVGRMDIAAKELS